MGRQTFAALDRRGHRKSAARADRHRPGNRSWALRMESVLVRCPGEIAYLRDACHRARGEISHRTFESGKAICGAGPCARKKSGSGSGEVAGDLRRGNPAGFMEGKIPAAPGRGEIGREFWAPAGVEWSAPFSSCGSGFSVSGGDTGVCVAVGGSGGGRRPLLFGEHDRHRSWVWNLHDVCASFPNGGKTWAER